MKNQEDNQRRYIRLGSNVTPEQKERYINELISYMNKSNHENRVTNIDLKQLKELKRWLTETVSQGCKGMSVHISLKSGFWILIQILGISDYIEGLLDVN